MKPTRAKIKRFIKSIWDLLKKHPLHRRTFILSAIILSVTTALPIWRIFPIRTAEPFIPLHYNIYFGVDRFGPWYEIFWLPAIGLLLILINIGFQAVLVRHEKHLAGIISITTLCLQAVLFSAMFMMILANI